MKQEFELLQQAFKKRGLECAVEESPDGNSATFTLGGAFSFSVEATPGAQNGQSAAPELKVTFPDTSMQKFPFASKVLPGYEFSPVLEDLHREESARNIAASIASIRQKQPVPGGA